MVVKIIMDTNFVIIPFLFKVDIYSEITRLVDEKYELCFPDICEAELAKLKECKASKALMETKNVKIIKVDRIKNVDNSIIEYAKKEKSIIATQDQGIKRIAKQENLEILTLRSKKYLIRL